MRTSDARKKIRAQRAAKRKKTRLAREKKVATKIINSEPKNIEDPSGANTPSKISKGPKKNTLVMFSSGLDSTAALFWMLRNTDDNIHVHRIILDNKEGRSKAENQAAENVIRWLRQNCRAFTYAESSYSYKGYTPYDMYIYMHMAAIRALEMRTKKRTLNRVVTGSIKMYRRSSGVEKRRAKAWKIFSSTYGYSGVEWFKPLLEFTKEDVYNYLPEGLSELTHSCRKPVNGGTKPCGKCHSCMAMKRVRGKLSKQQIRQYRRWNE